MQPTAPGSGLPVLTTLRDMVQSGDRVYSVSGSFSGSISYIFSALRDGIPFSKALQAAWEAGLCEPDPRDDLNGVDVTRSVRLSLDLRRPTPCPDPFLHMRTAGSQSAPRKHSS